MEGIQKSMSTPQLPRRIEASIQSPLKFSFARRLGKKKHRRFDDETVAKLENRLLSVLDYVIAMASHHSSIICNTVKRTETDAIWHRFRCEFVWKK
jgi:hypothetical protein